MQGIFQKENTDKSLKYGIYRHLPTYEKIIRNLVSFLPKNEKSFVVLRVVNSCAVAPEANGNLLKTTKNDASVHGYGTKSIRKTAKNITAYVNGIMMKRQATFHSLFCLTKIIEPNLRLLWFEILALKFVHFKNLPFKLYLPCK